MKKIFAICLVLTFLTFLIFPSSVLFTGNQNNGNNTAIAATTDLSSKNGGLVAPCPVTGCGFKELLDTVNNVINFALFYLATPLAAICFAYAGFLYLTSGGNTEHVGIAKKIIKNVLIGYVIALVAWLIVHTIFVTLGFTGGFLG